MKTLMERHIWRAHTQAEVDSMIELLSHEGIPSRYSVEGAGAYVQIYAGVNMLGFDLYVPEQWYDQAMNVIEQTMIQPELEGGHPEVDLEAEAMATSLDDYEPVLMQHKSSALPQDREHKRYPIPNGRVLLLIALGLYAVAQLIIIVLGLYHKALFKF